MGGDRMPDAAVDGALAAVRDPGDGLRVLLVGDEAALRAALDARPEAAEALASGALAVRHAPDVVAMEEAATDVRRRTGSSVRVAADAVKAGDAAALVSMGHSGATLATALLTFGRVRGLDRPAITATLPAAARPVTLLDVGANADAKPRMLQQFAVLGSVHARLVHGVERPTVGLLSIGEEPGKGNELVRATYPLLEATPGVAFHGNVEGRDLLEGTTDVVVTDGFTGNVALKLAEGEARVLFRWIREALRAGPRAMLGGWLAKPALRGIGARLDPSTYGAQPLLGVKAPTFIGHGSADARAVANALRFAAQAVRDDLVGRTSTALADAAAADPHDAPDG
jgi:glycerol-3-phosphate acyltransferase PlsX